MRVDLREYQMAAVDKLESGSILLGGVGSGKSRTSIAYFFTKVCKGSLNINGEGDVSLMETPRDLYIITTARKRDSFEWEGECAKFGLSTKPEVSFCGVRVTIASWNSIKKYKDVKGAFFILDEQRLVGYGAWVSAFLEIAKHNEWILLSATPGDVWMDYLPVFIANGFFKNKAEFTRAHVVYDRYSKYGKVDRYVDVHILNRYRRQILVYMPYERRTKRHSTRIFVSFDVEKFNLVKNKRWNPYTNEPIKQISEYFHTLRRVVNEDPSRLEAVVELHEKHKKVIVFYNFDYELELLRTLKERVDPEVTHIREWNGHVHEELPTNDNWIYFVQFMAGAEAWNCVTTDCLIFYSMNYFYRLREQAKGRIDRMNTPYTDLYYYSLMSASAIDFALEKAQKAKKNFNEKTILEAKNGLFSGPPTF